MSISNLRHRSPGREHLVRQNLQRDHNVARLVGYPRAESTADASAASSVVDLTPGSIKALIAFVVIFGIAVIGKHCTHFPRSGTRKLILTRICNVL